jgi:hypothetical protein
MQEMGELREIIQIRELNELSLRLAAQRRQSSLEAIDGTKALIEIGSVWERMELPQPVEGLSASDLLSEPEFRDAFTAIELALCALAGVEPRRAGRIVHRLLQCNLPGSEQGAPLVQGELLQCLDDASLVWKDLGIQERGALLREAEVISDSAMCAFLNELLTKPGIYNAHGLLSVVNALVSAIAVRVGTMTLDPDKSFGGRMVEVALGETSVNQAHAAMGRSIRKIRRIVGRAARRIGR